ncbi:MAG: hypothetical protein ACK559_17035, partial [bacterium]
MLGLCRSLAVLLQMFPLMELEKVSHCKTLVPVIGVFGVLIRSNSPSIITLSQRINQLIVETPNHFVQVFALFVAHLPPSIQSAAASRA